MSLNTETIVQIQAMLQADPALLAELQTQTELAGVAAVIAGAATAQGLDVSEADLLIYLTAQQSQAGGAAMSDTELEQVAGAGLGGAIGLSIIGVGFLCGMLSFSAALYNRRTC